MYNVTFQQLMAFIEVAEELNISAVAENNFVSQAALSKMIQRFEEGVGVRLFERTARGIHLTEEGMHFYERVVAPFQSICDTIEEIRELTDQKKRVIKIGYPSTVNMNRDYSNIVGIVNAYKKEHPEVSIEEYIFEATELKKQVALGKIGVAFLQSILFHDTKDVEIVPISKLSMHVAVGSRNPAIIHDTLNMRKLQQQTLYVLPSHAEGMSQYVERTQIKPSQTKVLPNFDTMLFHIRNNEGYAYVGNISLHPEDGIRVFPLEDGQNTHELCMIFKKNSESTMLAKFAHYIQSHVRGS